MRVVGTNATVGSPTARLLGASAPATRPSSYTTGTASFTTGTLAPRVGYSAPTVGFSASVQNLPTVSASTNTGIPSLAFPASPVSIAQPLASTFSSIAKPASATYSSVAQPFTTYAAPSTTFASIVEPTMAYEIRELTEDRIRRLPAVYKGEAPVCAVEPPVQRAVQDAYCLVSAFHQDPSDCKVQRFAASPDEITKEWLSAALNATVESFTMEVCEQGQCALTVLIKDIVYWHPMLNVTWAPVGEQRPSSLAIKMHGQTDEQRLMFSGLGHFTREVFFYTSFADQVPLLSPTIYGVWTDPNGLNLTSTDAAPVEYFNIMMADMNGYGRTFNPVVDGAHSSLDETREMLMNAREMHIQFFNNPVITQAPFSKSGANFTLDAKRPYVGFAAASWPPVRDNMPALSGWTDGFPEHASELVAFYDAYLANDGLLASAFIDNLEKVFQSRPMTLNHGDFNCGNVWQSAANPSEYSFADWQMYEMAPIGLDIESMLVTLGNGNQVTALMDEYHAGLPVEIQNAYSRSQLQDDFKGQLVIVAMIIVAIMAGQLDTSAMPQEKAYFCWSILWPKAFYNFGNLFADLRVIEFANTIIDGQYSNY